MPVPRVHEAWLGAQQKAKEIKLWTKVTKSDEFYIYVLHVERFYLHTSGYRIWSPLGHEIDSLHTNGHFLPVRLVGSLGSSQMRPPISFTILLPGKSTLPCCHAGQVNGEKMRVVKFDRC